METVVDVTIELFVLCQYLKGSWKNFIRKKASETALFLSVEVLIFENKRHLILICSFQKYESERFVWVADISMNEITKKEIYLPNMKSVLLIK